MDDRVETPATTDRDRTVQHYVERSGNGGTIVTSGGLVFVGANDDARFRAFEAKTGKELWTVKLPGAAEATPITYQGQDGRQYVVILRLVEGSSITR
jgi:quinoprotein glucose dehydrogenase